MRLKVAPLSIIVGVDTLGGFGKDGKIPWNIPEDMKHFQKVTNGGVCIMGRKTYEDMLEMVKKRKKKGSKKIKEILPGRESFVVTSDEAFKVEGATVVKNIHEAVQTLSSDDNREVFVIGGSRMFNEALTWTNKIYMTIVKDKEFDCDVFFPLTALLKFKITEGEQTDKLFFITYERQEN